jgi:hypothetical protein
MLGLLRHLPLKVSCRKPMSSCFIELKDGTLRFEKYMHPITNIFLTLIMYEQNNRALSDGDVEMLDSKAYPWPYCSSPLTAITKLSFGSLQTRYGCYWRRAGCQHTHYI